MTCSPSSQTFATTVHTAHRFSNHTAEVALFADTFDAMRAIAQELE